MLTSILVWGNVVIMQNSQKHLNNFFNTTSISLFLSSLSNLFASNKIWSLSFLFIFFSISGIPPLLGFLSKIFILLSLIQGDQILTAISLVLISVVSVFYYIRIIKIVFFEISFLQKNNNKFMQITLNNINSEVLVFSTFLFFLIVLFFYPTPLLLLSEYLVLNLLGF
jgi:NADH:ubiquinone oxidoreductase subunit 2 (subunit N)